METPSDASDHGYWSSFRKIRENTLAHKNADSTNPESFNDLFLDMTENFKTKKLSAKRKPLPGDLTLAQNGQLRPLSLRTIQQKNNPTFVNPYSTNSFSNYRPLSAKLPFMSAQQMYDQQQQMAQMAQMAQMYQMQQYAPQMIPQMQPQMPVSTRGKPNYFQSEAFNNNPRRLNNTLREQRIKLLEDEEFLNAHPKIGQFIYSKNQEALMKKMQEQTESQKNSRRKQKQEEKSKFGTKSRLIEQKEEAKKAKSKQFKNQIEDEENEDYFEEKDFGINYKHMLILKEKI